MTTLKTLTRQYALYSARDMGIQILSILNNTTSPKLGMTIAASKSAEPLSASFNDLVAKHALREDTDLFIRASQLAERALLEGIDNPESLTAYHAIAGNRSNESETLSAYLWDEASYMSRSLSMLTDVVMPTALRVSETIDQAITENRNSFDQGGQVTTFGWGLLADPMFTHSVLNYAQQKLNLFDPDQAPTAYYATVALAHADKLNDITAASDVDREIVKGYLDSAQIEGLEDDIEQILLKSTPLQTLTLHLKNDRANPITFMRNVTKLAQVHGQFVLLANHLDKYPNDVPEQLLQRVRSASDVLMCLEVAVEALRETDYNNTLIMGVEFPEGEPQTVIVNDDRLDNFKVAGYEPEQLLPIAAYLHMDKESPMPTLGYTQEWYQAHGPAIAQSAIEFMEQEDEKKTVQHIQAGYGIIRNQLTDLVNQYAAQLKLSKDQKQTALNQVERIVSSSRAEDANMPAQIVRLLNNIMATATESRFGDLLNALSDSADASGFESVLTNTIVQDMASDFFVQ